MKYNICSVYDRIAQLYSVPNFTNSKGSTVRAFADEVNRAAEGNQLYLHSDDFDIYFLGTYDDADGSFDILQTPELLARGANVKINKD